jgi:sigma-B regulation protein RsbU (phosphoserine phosphatase)
MYSPTFLLPERIRMDRINVLDTIGLDTSYADVLFVTNQERIPQQISSQLESHSVSWKKISVAEFIGDEDNWRDFSTIVLDTSEVRSNRTEQLWSRLKTLEQAGIGAILLNDHVDFPFDRFSLVKMLQTASVEEIWGRIETNLAFHNRLGVAGAEILQPPSSVVTEDTTEQLRMAGYVQRNFLPQKLPNLRNVRWAALFEPADWVSGDIYDVARLDEQHIGFYIADAVGHSMPAALLTMFLKQAIKMRETTGNEYRIFGPVEVVRNLNAAMSDQHLAGCLFATCCYCLLNVRTLQMTYARAGHPYPVIIRKGQPPRQLEGTGGLLGVFEDTPFDQHTVQLETGDKVFLFSDGCESSVGDTDEEGKFTFNKDFLATTNMPIEKMMSEFNRVVHRKRKDPAEIDDVTAVGFEIV